MHKRILITPGEPAGIGPDLTLQIAQQAWPAEIVAVADPDLLASRADQLKIPFHWEKIDLKKPPSAHKPGTLKIFPVTLSTSVQAGKLNPQNAPYVLRTLEIATDACLKNEAHALVTGPVNKAVMQEAHLSFLGHTEFLAQRCGVQRVIMLFVTDKMKVALATTHLPLAQVPQAITQDLLISTLRLLSTELKKIFQIEKPHILVCGLNPHAGEQGHLGREEIEIIEPALQQLRKENIHVTGPLPADTIFTESYLEKADAILAMYHDQALPVVKYAGFSHAVNVTLGLPIIRTSVDHGTALDIAGTNKADAGSFISAIQLAIKNS